MVGCTAQGARVRTDETIKIRVEYKYRYRSSKSPSYLYEIILSIHFSGERSSEKYFSALYDYCCKKIALVFDIDDILAPITIDNVVGLSWKKDWLTYATLLYYKDKSFLEVRMRDRLLPLGTL